MATPGYDTPLVLINRGFCELTGDAASDVVGRNCRLLQGGLDDQQARSVLRNFLRQEEVANVRTLIVNFKKDGTPFVNLLYMSRLRSLDDTPRFFFASQFDVSRAHSDRLESYDRDLGATLKKLTPLAAEAGSSSNTSRAKCARLIFEFELAAQASTDVGRHGSPSGSGMSALRMGAEDQAVARMGAPQGGSGDGDDWLVGLGPDRSGGLDAGGLSCG